MTVGLVLWDIDGTLLAGGDRTHIDGLRQALSDVSGRAVSFDGIQLGGNIERRICAAALLAAGVDRASIKRLTDAAIQAVGDHYESTVTDRRDRLLPGVTAILNRATDRFHHGVLTGGARRVARAKLAAARIDHHLTFGAYGDEADERHELVDHALNEADACGLTWTRVRRHVIVVGDTPADIEAARTAGVSVVAVATGRWSLEQLSELRPDAALSDLSNTELVLDTLDAVRSRHR